MSCVKVEVAALGSSLINLRFLWTSSNTSTINPCLTNCARILRALSIIIASCMREERIYSFWWARSSTWCAWQPVGKHYPMEAVHTLKKSEESFSVQREPPWVHVALSRSSSILCIRHNPMGSHWKQDCTDQTAKKTEPSVRMTDFRWYKQRNFVPHWEESHNINSFKNEKKKKKKKCLSMKKRQQNRKQEQLQAF